MKNIYNVVYEYEPERKKGVIANENLLLSNSMIHKSNGVAIKTTY